MKRCPKCKAYKSRREFFKDKARKDGLQCHCKDCRCLALIRWQKENKGLCSSYTKKWYGKKTKFYIEYKKELKCQECDENHLACLEFHHRNPDEKDFGIGNAIVAKGIEQLIDEIAKCDVLCSNCHRKLHYALKETEK